MTPNAVAQITDSDLISTLDIALPQYAMNTLFLKHGSQGLAYLMTRSLGFEKEVKADTYGHFEKDDSYENFTVNGTVGDPGAGNSITIVLSPSSLDSNNKYFPRENDEVMYKNEVVGWITDITVTVDGLGAGINQVALTIMPNDITDSIGTVTAGDTVIIISATFTEGSGMPDEVVSGTTKYTNEAQIIKENIGATGTALTTETYIKQLNEAGEYLGYYNPAYFDLDYRMMTKIDGMFWFSKRISTTAGRALNATTGYVHKATEGLVPAIRRLGNVNTYTVGAYAISKFNEYERVLAKEYVPSTTPVWTALGLYLYQEVEDKLVTYFANTNIEYTRKVVNDMLFNKNESLGASVNFKYLTKSGRTFLFHKLDGFSNPKTYGSTGYDMQKMGVICPLDKSKDPKTNESIPSIGVRYRAMGGYNRRMITSTLSGIGASYKRQPVTTIDKTNTYQFAHMGTEFYGINRFILIDNA